MIKLWTLLLSRSELYYIARELSQWPSGSILQVQLSPTGSVLTVSWSRHGVISRPKTSAVFLSTEAVANHTIVVGLSSSTKTLGGVTRMLAGWYCCQVRSPGVPGSNVDKKPSYCTARSQHMRLGASLVGVPFTAETLACLNTGPAFSKPD